MSKVIIIPRLTRDLEGRLVTVPGVYGGPLPLEVIESHIDKVCYHDGQGDLKPLDALNAYTDTFNDLEKIASKYTANSMVGYLKSSLDSVFKNYFRLEVAPARKKAAEDAKRANEERIMNATDHGTICTMRDCIHLLSRKEQELVNAYMDYQQNATATRRDGFGVPDEHKKAFNNRLEKALLHLAQVYAENCHVRGDLVGGKFKKLFMKIGTRVVFVGKGQN
jgi:hypothetical protein